MRSPSQPCEGLRLLGHHLLELLGDPNRDGPHEVSNLNLVHHKITEHRLHCPICAEFSRQRDLLYFQQCEKN